VSTNPSFALTRAVLAAGQAAHAFPAAVIEVGRASGPLLRHAVGPLHYGPDAPRATPDTVFDLASLTKVIATTSFVMRPVAAGRLSLTASVHERLPLWSDPQWERIQVKHLLDHSSGLPAHARLWEQGHGREGYEALLRQTTANEPPGSASVYSDVGFMVLGYVIEGLGDSLDRHMTDFAADLATPTLRYRPPPEWRERTAPTEFDSWRGRLLVAEVHDEDAAALGGVAAHAGLFGTAADVGTFARVVLRTWAETTALGDASLMEVFSTPTGVPGSSRALGWDTMLPTSSCGSRLSPTAIGHTGFTGTSLWIDREQDLYVVLLTNRVHPSRANDSLRMLRPRIHDAVVEDLRARSVP
jgi:serine-type D-Ala-D-Ala carboxypeptidase